MGEEGEEEDNKNKNKNQIRKNEGGGKGKGKPSMEFVSASLQPPRRSHNYPSTVFTTRRVLPFYPYFRSESFLFEIIDKMNRNQIIAERNDRKKFIHSFNII